MTPIAPMESNKIYNHQKIRLALLNELAEISTIDEDYFFRSKQFPAYPWGSGAIINSNKFKSLQSIIDQFKTRYPRVPYYSISYFDQENSAKIATEAYQAQHTVYHTKIMSTPVSELQPKLSPTEHRELVRAVKNEKDWALYKQHEEDCHQDRAYVEERYTRKRFITPRLDLQWFALFNKTNTQILSSAGLLKVDNLAQLKNVQTNPHEQRKGYATTILGEISHSLLAQKAVEEVYLITEKNNEKAFGIYDRLGFVALPSEFVEIVISA